LPANESTNAEKKLIAKAIYNCARGKTITAEFYQGEEATTTTDLGQPPIPTGSVQIVLSDGRNFNLAQTLSADGARYANDDESFIFWSKGEGALVLENGAEKNYTDCVEGKNE